MFIDRSFYNMLGIAMTAAAFGCGPTPPNDVPVTGKNSADPTWEFTQSETSMTVAESDGRVIVISSNDETDTSDTITYDQTSRRVFAGASQMGHAYSTDGGASWVCGGNLATPHGQVILWGDPALATLRYPSWGTVVMSNLSGRSEGFPADGVVGSVADVLTGACIARSTDGGRTFAAWGCLHHENSFYDGGSMTAYSESGIAAAYFVPNEVQADVWIFDPTQTTPLCVRLPRPFPGLKVIHHPIVRSNERGHLYVMSAVELITGSIVIAAAIYRDGSWSPPKIVASAGQILPGPVLSMGNRKLRTARNFDFDLGRADATTESEELRLLVGSKTSVFPGPGVLELHGYRCDSDLTGCSGVPGWAATGPGDRFRPRIRYAGIGLSTGQALAVWKATYDSRQHNPAGQTLTIFQGNMAFDAWLPQQLTDPHEVCSDLRGYWGDYDEFVSLRPGDLGGPIEFVHAFSDSSAGCKEEDRWEYDTKHLHVSAVRFP